MCVHIYNNLCIYRVSSRLKITTRITRITAFASMTSPTIEETFFLLLGTSYFLILVSSENAGRITRITAFASMTNPTTEHAFRGPKGIKKTHLFAWSNSLLYLFTALLVYFFTCVLELPVNASPLAFLRAYSRSVCVWARTI